MSFKSIDYRVENNTATIVLNRPQRYNSFNDEMHREMRSALKQVAADHNLRCLVITGSGKAFCTGQDLNDRYTMVQEGKLNLGASLEKHYNPLIQSIADLSIPVICAVNGVAAGAGISLALACDIVIAATSAKFVFAFSKVGLIPDAGATWSLVQALGLPRARALALLGESLSGEEAQEAGLIWACVADESLDNAVGKTARNLMANPALGLTLTRRALSAATANRLTEQLALEAQWQTIAGRSPDYEEAIAAFVEKRQPAFRDH